MGMPTPEVTAATVGDSSIFKYQLLPPLGETEFAELKADIREKGVLVAIEFDENGMPLDGHNRLRAIGELEREGYKIPYEAIVRRGMSEEQKYNHVVSINFKRRHMTLDQRAQAIARIRASGKTVVEIAELTGSTRATVHRDIQRAQELGIPTEPTEPVAGKDGKFRPASYFKPSFMSFAEQTRRDDAEERKLRKTIAPDDMPDLGGRYKIIQGSLGDLDEMGKYMPDGSLDVIITDPPYPYEYIETWSMLSAFGKRFLRPGGLCIAMSGHFYLPEVMQRLGENLDYVWTISCLLQGAHPLHHARRVSTGWKPFLVYSNGPLDRENQGVFYDVMDVKSAPDKNYHIWGQDLQNFEKLVMDFSAAGQMVCDPFLGGGTTMMAALKLNRYCIGIDNDEETLNVSKKRIADTDWSGITGG